MKKILIGFAGFLIMAFVILLFINAGEKKQGTNKVKTELKAEAAKGPCMMECNHMKVNAVKPCASAKCQLMVCDPEKCGKSVCDPANCQANCEKACTKTISCCPVASSKTGR
jgi:hypothetical protein